MPNTPYLGSLPSPQLWSKFILFPDYCQVDREKYAKFFGWLQAGQIEGLSLTTTARFMTRFVSGAFLEFLAALSVFLIRLSHRYPGDSHRGPYYYPGLAAFGIEAQPVDFQQQR